MSDTPMRNAKSKRQGLTCSKKNQTTAALQRFLIASEPNPCDAEAFHLPVGSHAIQVKKHKKQGYSAADYLAFSQPMGAHAMVLALFYKKLKTGKH
jgi:hypothetical protein